MGVGTDSAQTRKVFEATDNTVGLQAIQKSARVSSDSLGRATEHAILQDGWVNAMHINYGSEVSVDTELEHPFCCLRALSKSVVGTACGSHSRSRGQISMKRIKAVDLTTFLVSGNHQGNFS